MKSYRELNTTHLSNTVDLINEKILNLLNNGFISRDVTITVLFDRSDHSIF